MPSVPTLFQRSSAQTEAEIAVRVVGPANPAPLSFAVTGGCGTRGKCSRLRKKAGTKRDGPKYP